MVKHVIIWTLKPNIDKDKQKELIKEGLESLVGKIDGLIDVKVITNHLATSNGDVMLEALFRDFDALKEYSVNPEHVKVADEAVRPFVMDRKCVDYEIKE